MLAGAALAVVVPAAVAGIALQRSSSARWSRRLAAGFADLPLAPGVGQVVLVAGGLRGARGGGHRVVARRAMREPVVAGLREE